MRDEFNEAQGCSKYTPRAPLKTLEIFLFSPRVLGPVHTTPEEFENGDSILKMHRMFSVHTTMPEEFKNATITRHFRFMIEENSGREITWLY